MHATIEDHKIISEVAVRLGGRAGRSDDVSKVMNMVECSGSEHKLMTACEIAVAFIRYAQDLRDDKESLHFQLRENVRSSDHDSRW